MANHSLAEEFESSGEWFVAESPERKISGAITWSSRRVTLQLNDSFLPLEGGIGIGETSDYSAIYGETSRSELITVLDAVTSGQKFTFSSAGVKRPQKLSSSWAIIGAHVTPNELYSEVSVRIPGLQIWISRSGVEQTIVYKTETTPSYVLYKVEGMAEEVFNIPSIEAKIGWGIHRNFSGDLVSDIAVKTSAWIRIEPLRPQGLDWFFEQLGKITTLLSFIAGTAMSPDQIAARAADSDTELSVLVALRQELICGHKKADDFFMLRQGMGIELSEVFGNWFALYERIAMPSQLALSIFSSEKLWLHVEFISLIQALEGFHRATATIPESSDKSRPSLKRRLDELTHRLSPSIRKVILNGDGSLPKSWVATRNYFTHWEETLRSSALDGMDMHRANVRMKHLLRAILLEHAGVPQSAIEDSLQNGSRDSQYLLQINSAERKRPDSSNEREDSLKNIDVRDAEGL